MPEIAYLCGVSISLIRRWSTRNRVSLLLLAFCVGGLSLWKFWDGPAVVAPIELPMTGFQLDRDSVVELQLPPSNREIANGPIPVSGPWILSTTHEGIRTWEAPIPVRPRTLFFHRAPDDMAVFRRTDPSQSGWDTALRLEHRSGRASTGVDNSWTFTSRTIRVRRALADGPPSPGEYAVRYTRAVERENELNLEYSGMGEPDFVFRSLQVEDTTRTGILLPAPGVARFSVQLPEAAMLEFDAMVLPSEASDPALRSDGAAIRVSLTVDGTRHELLDSDTHVNDVRTHRIDLSSWANQVVELSLESLTGETPDLDYVFFADPVIFTPTTNPRRMVLVFIDTLRPDHMSLYGAERSTTPRLDAWAADAAIFENARSIAPWTLPSTRTMLTGQIPELWGSTPTLQAMLAEQGWATSFVAGNIYLSSNFDMSNDWSEHRCINWPQAEVQVDRALDFLSENPNRDAFVLLHLMDMHLPYTEPREYTGLFAGERPQSLGRDDFHRRDVVDEPLNEAGQQYVRDRYDQNLRYVDDQLARFLSELPDDATVMILSDHGEEFWDHDEFEHGHSLYDELLRIPMVLRGPGITPGRFEEPVSMLDVTPTLVTSVGLDTSEMLGWPLQQLVDGSRSEAFSSRPQAFGRPLYGLRRWGSLSDGRKYMTHEGEEQLFDLESDPSESTNLLEELYEPDAMVEAMALALNREVLRGFRVTPTRSSARADLTIEINLPGGFAHVVIGEDPLDSSQVSTSVSEDGNTLTAIWAGNERGTREVFFVPNDSIEDVVMQMSIVARRGQTSDESNPQAIGSGPAEQDGRGGVVMQARVSGTTIKVTHSIVVIPPTGEEALRATDNEVQAELEALGYTEL